MHRLFGDGPVGFHSREQEEGVRAVLNAETPVTVVLPTGRGKTLLAMLSVVLETRGVSIFIAPFRALVDDMARRFRAAGIDYFEWHHGENNPARLVIGIVFILYIDIPWSMIDFAQESGRGGRAGETVDSLILVTQRAAEVRLQRRHLDVEAEVMAKFVDSHDAEWVRCDRYGEGEHEVRTRTRQDEEERRLVEEALTEMTIGCAYY
ncbi:hypothetical protein LTR98_011656 [Exophiala xenobiotica]|nr:hypothetical protein LTR98_011656 [Exophiala xenobiotica]